MPTDRFGMFLIGSVLVNIYGETCKVTGHSKKTLKGTEVSVYKVKYLTGPLTKKARSIERAIIDKYWIEKEEN